MKGTNNCLEINELGLESIQIQILHLKCNAVWKDWCIPCNIGSKSHKINSWVTEKQKRNVIIRQIKIICMRNYFNLFDYLNTESDTRELFNSL